MKDDHWRRVESLFHECAQLTGRQRAQLLDRRCAGDERLRQDVEAAIEASHHDGFIADLVRLAIERLRLGNHTEDP